MLASRHTATRLKELNKRKLEPLFKLTTPAIRHPGVLTVPVGRLHTL